MGNIVHRVGIEPTSLAVWASVLTISPPKLPGGTMLPTSAYLRGSQPEWTPTYIYILEYVYMYISVFICVNMHKYICIIYVYMLYI